MFLWRGPLARCSPRFFQNSQMFHSEPSYFSTQNKEKLSDYLCILTVFVLFTSLGQSYVLQEHCISYLALRISIHIHCKNIKHLQPPLPFSFMNFLPWTISILNPWHRSVNQSLYSVSTLFTTDTSALISCEHFLSAAGYVNSLSFLKSIRLYLLKLNYSLNRNYLCREGVVECVLDALNIIWSCLSPGFD